MLRKFEWLLAGTTVVMLLGLLVFGGLIIPTSNAKNSSKTYNHLYVDSMHPWIMSEEPGTCSICGMNLSEVNNHTPGDPAPGIDNLFVSSDNPMWIHEGPGTDPETGEKLIPIKESPYYQEPEEEPEMEHTAQPAEVNESPDHQHQVHVEEEGQLYTCGMHPEVIQDEPGICPICNMELTPLKRKGSSSSGEREIAYWVAPMDPGFVSDKPGKSPMGMDLVPVYTDQLSEGTVEIDPVTLQSIGVKTQPVEKRDLSRALRSNGIVEAAEENEFKVNARVDGWVEKLYVSRTGDHIKKGQPLLEIYSPQLVSAQEDLIVSSKGNPGLLKAARQRLALWNISEKQIDEIEKTGQVKQTLTITSPGNGIVLHKNIVEGSSIKSGMDLFLIADLKKIWIIAQVYEYELPWIKIGDKVTVKSPYSPELNMDGTISFIYPTLNSKSRTINVRIEVSNPDLKLLPDMYVDVIVQTSTQNQAVAIPKSAVIRSGLRDLVFVKRGIGRFEPVEVRIGLETDTYYEVKQGLFGGEEVVVSAQFLLDSEAKLQEAIQRRIEKQRQKKSS